jgi:hypothetical protein
MKAYDSHGAPTAAREEDGREMLRRKTERKG